MKKFRILVLAGLVSLTITGCKSTNEELIECHRCGRDYEASEMKFRDNKYYDEVCYDRVFRTNLEPEQVKKEEAQVSYDFNCVYCNKPHNESDSYYNEDGMSACSQNCFEAFTGSQTQVAKQESIKEEPKVAKQEPIKEEPKVVFKEYGNEYKEYENRSKETGYQTNHPIDICRGCSQVKELTHKYNGSARCEDCYNRLIEYDNKYKQEQETTSCPECGSSNISVKYDKWINDLAIHCNDCNFRN